VSEHSRPAPRLVARALTASFLTVALILTAVFVLVSVEVRQRVRTSVEHNLDAAQQAFAQMESRREHEMRLMIATLAENPTLKAALDTWQAERRVGGGLVGEAISTVQNEVAKIADNIEADVLTVVDAHGAIVASAGRHAAAFAPGAVMRSSDADEVDEEAVMVTKAGAFRMLDVPLELVGVTIGRLQLGTALDFEYAHEMATLARANSAVVIGDRVWATTLPASIANELGRSGAPAGNGSSIVELNGQSWLVRHVNTIGAASFLALASIDEAAASATDAALRGLAWVALASVGLGAFASFWLARTLSRPIDELSASVSSMASERNFGMVLPQSGSSRELNLLAASFNSLIQSLAAAEAETQAAYLGAVRALAAALDARDPYTAGHSERVSALSVEIGRAMRLAPEELDTLRLGALLHDIGKIGVPDELLRKPAALSAREFEMIRAHPVIGARILRSIRFLAPYLPIVELHHERPDGTGYPYGLVGDAIPLTARIVHVADAYDAITSARAYRPARLPHEAIAELQRLAGTDFDGAAVDALISVAPRLSTAASSFDSGVLRWRVAAGSAS
jgi:putative nucleotidyltransferase with HDIG domain